MCVLFISQHLQLVGSFDTRTPVKPQQLGGCCFVRNSGVSEVLVALRFCQFFFKFSVVIRDFVIGLSQISFFFSLHLHLIFPDT